MNTRKWSEALVTYLVFAILFSGCAAYQPSAYGIAPLKDGEIVNLYQGTAKWLASGGDNYTRTYINARMGITVNVRPLMDGFAFACHKAGCEQIMAFVTNNNTHKTFIAALADMGFELAKNVAIPAIPLVTILVIPVVPLASVMCSGGLGVYDEAGNCVAPVSLPFTADGSDGLTEESEDWEVLP